MSDSNPSSSCTTLRPAGHRWGRGARSLLPYLASARLRAGEPAEQERTSDAISNPVFRHMDIRMLWRDR